MELEFAIIQTHVHELNKNDMKLELASYHESTTRECPPERSIRASIFTFYNIKWYFVIYRFIKHIQIEIKYFSRHEISL